MRYEPLWEIITFRLIKRFDQCDINFAFICAAIWSFDTSDLYFGHDFQLGGDYCFMFHQDYKLNSATKNNDAYPGKGEFMWRVALIQTATRTIKNSELFSWIDEFVRKNNDILVIANWSPALLIFRYFLLATSFCQ